MDNICENTFYASSDNYDNIEYIEDFLKDRLEADVEISDYIVDAWFNSECKFPEEIMEELYKNLPDKSDIYMRCLSVEYNTLYHVIWCCDEDGWVCY